MAAKAELKARITLDGSAFAKGIASAIKQADSFAKSVAAFAAGGLVKDGIEKLGASIEGIGRRFYDGVKGALELGANLTDVSRRTGIAAGQVLLLQQAYKDAGLDSSELGGNINKMQRFLDASSDATSGASSKLAELGMSYQQLAAMSPDVQFDAIAMAINGIGDPSRKAAAAMEIFGKSGGKLLQVFAQMQETGGAGGLKRILGDQIQILDQEGAYFKSVQDKIGHMGAKASGFFVGMASSLSERLFLVLDKIEHMDFTKYGQEIGDSMGKFADAALGAFKNPQMALHGLKLEFIGIALTFGNYFMNALEAAGKFFSGGGGEFAKGFGYLGQYLQQTLVISFDLAIARFKIGMGEAISALSGSLEVFGVKLDNAMHMKGFTIPKEQEDWILNVKNNKNNSGLYQSGIVGETAALSASDKLGKDNLTGKAMNSFTAGVANGSKSLPTLAQLSKDRYGASDYFQDAGVIYDSLANTGNIEKNVKPTGQFGGMPLSSYTSRYLAQQKSNMGAAAFNKEVYGTEQGDRTEGSRKPMSRAGLAQLVNMYGHEAVFGTDKFGHKTGNAMVMGDERSGYRLMSNPGESFVNKQNKPPETHGERIASGVEKLIGAVNQPAWATAEQ